MSLSLPSLGQPAPSFITVNQRNETVNLADLKGKKVVLYFYPKAMTPGCTTQACALRDSIDEYTKRNIVVLGISPDPAARLQKFEDKHELNFDLLSDENHSIAESYGVWAMKKFMGKEYVGIHRLTFIIDEQGTLVHIMEKVKTKTHHDDVLDIINELEA